MSLCSPCVPLLACWLACWLAPQPDSATQPAADHHAKYQALHLPNARTDSATLHAANRGTDPAPHAAADRAADAQADTTAEHEPDAAAYPLPHQAADRGTHALSDHHAYQPALFTPHSTADIVAHHRSPNAAAVEPADRLPVRAANAPAHAGPHARALRRTDTAADTHPYRLAVADAEQRPDRCPQPAALQLSHPKAHHGPVRRPVAPPLGGAVQRADGPADGGAYQGPFRQTDGKVRPGVHGKRGFASCVSLSQACSQSTLAAPAGGLVSWTCLT